MYTLSMIQADLSQETLLENSLNGCMADRTFQTFLESCMCPSQADFSQDAFLENCLDGRRAEWTFLTFLKSADPSGVERVGQNENSHYPIPTTKYPVRSTSIPSTPCPSQYPLPQYPLHHTLYPLPHTLYPLPHTLYPLPHTLSTYRKLERIPIRSTRLSMDRRQCSAHQYLNVVRIGLQKTAVAT